MADTNRHPLLELLELSGLSSLIVGGNFSSFINLKEALNKDNKIPLVFYEHDVAAPLPQDLYDTNSLFQNENHFLHALIESWCLSVTSPMLAELNCYADNGNELTAYFDGEFYSGCVYFENTDVFINSLGSDDVDSVHAILSEWSHTVEMFGNAKELTEALTGA
ncbi:MAG: hypothetical protein ACTIJH_06370 [Moraxellaceae bacterium]